MYDVDVVNHHQVCFVAWFGVQCLYRNTRELSSINSSVCMFQTLIIPPSMCGLRSEDGSAVAATKGRMRRTKPMRTHFSRDFLMNGSTISIFPSFSERWRRFQLEIQPKFIYFFINSFWKRIRREERLRYPDSATTNAYTLTGLSGRGLVEAIKKWIGIHARSLCWIEAVFETTEIASRGFWTQETLLLKSTESIQNQRLENQLLREASARATKLNGSQNGLRFDRVDPSDI